MDIVFRFFLNKLSLSIGMIVLSLNFFAQNSPNIDSKPLFGQYSIKYFNTENGLPQNEVVDLYLTKHKFLWITTRIGLARYDGRELKQMKAPGDVVSFSLDFPWFYHQKDGTVTTLFGGETPVRIKENQFDLELYEKAKMFKLSFGSKGSFRFSSSFNSYQYEFVPIDSNSLYLESEEGLVFSRGGKTFPLKSSPKSPLRLENCFLLNKRTFNLCPSGHVLEFNGNIIDTLFHDPALQVKGEKDKNQIIWHYGREDCFLLKNNGLYKIELGNNRPKFRLILSDLPNVRVQAVSFSEKDDLLFLGTRKSGLMQISKSSIIQTQIDETCFGSVDNYAIARIGKDSIINTSGILFHNKQSPCEKLFVENLEVKSLFYDEQSEIIYGSIQGGLLAINKNSPRETKNILLEGNPERGRNIMKYKGEIYFTIPGKGLCKLKNGKIEVLVKFSFENRSNAFQLKAFSDSVFYMAGNFGIAKINPLNGEHELLDVPLFGGVTSMNLFDDVFWATTYGNGILIRIDNQWRNFSPPNYKALKYSHEIKRIGDKIFIPTNSGLYSFDINKVYQYVKEKLDIIHGYAFNETDGLEFNEFNGRCQNTTITTKDGNIYFPTLKGIVKFNSKAFNPYPVRKEIFVEHILVNDKDTIGGSSFNLDSQFENFSVKVLHPYYDDPKNAMTYRRIPEISKSWFQFNISEPIKIDRLPPGAYSLEIFIPGFDSDSNSKQKLLSFEVKPPFYNTPEFYAAAFLVLVLFIFMLVLLLQLRARKNRIRLEKIISKRTSELAESKNDVEKALKIREKMITVFSHDIRGPLSYFRQIVSEVQHKVKTLEIKEIDKELDYLHMSADASFTTANNVVNWIEGQIRLEEGERTIVNLEEEVFQVMIKRAVQIERSGIKSSFHIPPCHIEMETGGMEIILNNIIQNALKYTRTKINIEGILNQNEVELAIMDDGGGIVDLERLKKLNTGGPISSRVGRNGQLGSGLGLFMVREIVGRNHGNLKFVNFEDGLKVILTFPLVDED